MTRRELILAGGAAALTACASATPRAQGPAPRSLPVPPGPSGNPGRIPGPPHLRPTTEPSPPRQPWPRTIVLITDINHPRGDVDDHIDLAFAAATNAVTTVIFDLYNTGSYLQPYQQMQFIANLQWPAYPGLAPGAVGQTPLLDVLRDVPEPATVITTGSCRDLADAIMTDPDLCHEKITRATIFAGDYASRAPVEANVSMDPRAFVTVMTSGLPIRWVPCFDGGLWSAGTHSSYVPTTRAAVFPSDMQSQVKKFFSYRLLESNFNPLAWIHRPVDANDTAVLTSGAVNLWASSLLTALLDDACDLSYQGARIAGCATERITFNDAGQVDPNGAYPATVDVFQTWDRAAFNAQMIEATATALRTVGT